MRTVWRQLPLLFTNECFTHIHSTSLESMHWLPDEHLSSWSTLKDVFLKSVKLLAERILALLWPKSIGGLDLSDKTLDALLSSQTLITNALTQQLYRIILANSQPLPLSRGKERIFLQKTSNVKFLARHWQISNLIK